MSFSVLSLESGQTAFFYPFKIPGLHDSTLSLVVSSSSEPQLSHGFQYEVRVKVRRDSFVQMWTDLLRIPQRTA